MHRQEEVLAADSRRSEAHLPSACHVPSADPPTEWISILHMSVRTRPRCSRALPPLRSRQPPPRTARCDGGRWLRHGTGTRPPARTWTSLKLSGARDAQTESTKWWTIPERYQSNNGAQADALRGMPSRKLPPRTAQWSPLGCSVGEAVTAPLLNERLCGIEPKEKWLRRFRMTASGFEQSIIPAQDPDNDWHPRNV